MNLSEAQLISRRAFMRQGVCAALGATGLLSTIASLRMVNAATSLQSALEGPGDYRALVCLFLYGGNDANNMLVPVDAETYAAYAAARQVLALPRDLLLPISPRTPDGRSYALHPAMTGLQELFGSGKLAILANVGTLVAPVTRAQYRAGTVALPRQLFSHNDQSVQWQTSLPDQTSRTGWGGRVADLVQALNSNERLSMSISLAGTNQWQVGANVSQYQVTSSGSITLSGMTGSTNNVTRANAIRSLIAMEKRNLFELAYSDTLNRAIDNDVVLRAALDSTPAPTTVFPTSSLAQQLRMIARLVKAGPGLGFRRQIFFASVGGYDTHGDQLTAHTNLFTDLSASMTAFYNATVEYGVENSVTLFTASDFGRTCATNGEGSDHGWGNHQLILGGAVRGGDLYGAFPQLVINGADDTGKGRWIPTTSVDEYSATLARWFGVAESDLSLILPNLPRFARPNLGFMG
jgi:uncharacterized protein (DUF1501 family)